MICSHPLACKSRDESVTWSSRRVDFRASISVGLLRPLSCLPLLMADHDRASLTRRFIFRAQLSQTELETVSHWIKQLVALGHGVACGLLPMVAFNAFASFGIAMVVAMWGLTSYLRVDLEPEQLLELIKEGAMPAVAVFVLTYITTFTVIHH